MSLRRTVVQLLPFAAAAAGCADGASLPTAAPRLQQATAPAPETGRLDIEPEAPCAWPRVEAWTGTASRTAETYPDDIATQVTWRRVGSSGCVDRYAPSGDATYSFRIPGAICRQAIAPSGSAVAGGNGTLTVDRSTAPATYRGSGATTWAVTWTCTQDDGTTETMTFDAGGRWFEASGELEGAAIAGARVEEDGARCGQGHSALPCTYTWSFDPLE